MRSFTSALAAIVLATTVNAGAHRGSCADQGIQPKQNFAQARMAGRWYEIARDQQFSVPTDSCITEDWVENFNGTVIIAKNSYTLEEGWKQNKTNAVLLQTGDNNYGSYNAYGEDEQADRSEDAEFFVLATDYETWAIEYTCVNILPGYLYYDSMSIKARDRQLDSSTLTTIELIINGAIPLYDTTALFYSEHCRICPYSSIPEVVADQ